MGKKLIPTREHIIPKSKGGANYGKNVCTCCSSCNNLRGNLSFFDFRLKLEDLMEKSRTEDPNKTFKYQAMIINLGKVQEYANKMGEKLKKKV